MGIIEDILNALDRVERWKNLRQMPEKVSLLEQKVTALEEKLGAKWPADVCRRCGARTARLQHVYDTTNTKGNVHEIWKCSALDCGQQDHRFYQPTPR